MTAIAPSDRMHGFEAIRRLRHMLGDGAVDALAVRLASGQIRSERFFDSYADTMPLTADFWGTVNLTKGPPWLLIDKKTGEAFDEYFIISEADFHNCWPDLNKKTPAPILSEDGKTKAATQVLTGLMRLHPSLRSSDNKTLQKYVEAQLRYPIGGRT